MGWHIAVNCEAPDSIHAPDKPAVGIDRGVTVPLMLSDGTTFALPPTLDSLERRHRAAQRAISRRRRGSNRWRKAIHRAATLKAKQTRTRRHWQHEVTTTIARRHGTVVVEELRTRNLTRSARGTIETPGRGVGRKRGLNRAILHVGWHAIEAMLAYKTERLVRVPAAYSSQTCASCGTVDGRSRKSQASFVCAKCGHRDHADRNAATVILLRGSAPVVEGHVDAPSKRELEAA